MIIDNGKIIATGIKDSLKNMIQHRVLPCPHSVHVSKLADSGCVLPFVWI